MWVCLPVCSHAETWEDIGAFFYHSLHLIASSQGPSLNPKFTILSGGPACSQDLLVSGTQCWSYRHIRLHPGFRVLNLKMFLSLCAPDSTTHSDAFGLWFLLVSPFNPSTWCLFSAYISDMHGPFYKKTEAGETPFCLQTVSYLVMGICRVILWYVGGRLSQELSNTSFSSK